MEGGPLNVGYAFVTDYDGPNPYDGLPSDWDAEVEAVRRVNQAAPRGTAVTGEA